MSGIPASVILVRDENSEITIQQWYSWGLMLSIIIFIFYIWMQNKTDYSENFKSLKFDGNITVD